MSLRTLTRRDFLKLGGAGALAGLGVYTGWVEPHWLEIVRRPLPIAGLPGGLSGRTLVQVSDAHLGLQVDDNYLIESFQRVAALAPDILVFTGDFITYHADVFTQFPGVYRYFPTGRLATLAILGNHDYGPAWSHPEIAERVVESITPFGVTVLRNEIREVEGLQIAGLDDLWGGRFQPGPVLAALDRTQAALVLSHNPDTADRAVWEGYRGWILSGHTHGGQCRPPFLPPPLLPVQNRRYTAGEFALAGNRKMYISRGVGHLLQARFNVRPEVTIFELGAA